ncbi:hypothetical protein ACFSCX_06750 [Bacillus salitolerans]|uniref:Uncharacterized protein n=1 Tax=Bacillus salitolerans TaxID=1437434 RepID=A0ABW4LMJ7_9BACI
MMMDVYEHEALRYSIDNLLMLKIFHDKGVNVQSFPDPRVSSHEENDAGIEILTKGLTQLFSYFSFDTEDLKSEIGENYEDIVSGDGPFILIKDKELETLLKGPLGAEFVGKFLGKDSKLMDFTEIFPDFDVLPEQTGVVISLNWAFVYSEILEALLILLEEIKKYTKRGEDERNGITDYNHRQSA